MHSFIYSLIPTLGDFYHYWPTEDKGKIEFGYITVTQTSTEQRVSYVKREFTVYNQKVEFSSTASLQLGPICLLRGVIIKIRISYLFLVWHIWCWIRIIRSVGVSSDGEKGRIIYLFISILNSYDLFTLFIYLTILLSLN